MRYTSGNMSRFGIREATLEDADGIARAHAASWRMSYRGILPDSILDRIDVGQRVTTRRRILKDRSVFQLVAYDLTHGDIVGFCDAGQSRRHVPFAGELYAIYLVQHAKRHGIGQQLFERVTMWLRANGMESMIVWVLENNAHARGFYEAMGGYDKIRLQTAVGGFPVVELGYVWDRL
ncbi:MAG: family N-acetyltransferase [Myxococcales bacterium]|nr:family N-acetyltransferase [Myxococcales bacterium]